MIEGQELMTDGAPNAELITMLRNEVDVDRCMFEVSTPYVGSTLHEVFVGKKFLIKTFDPDVNLGHILSDVVIETEVTRLGTADPLQKTYPRPLDRPHNHRTTPARDRAPEAFGA